MRDTQTHNRKEAENESCSQQGTQCVYATLSACVCYVSLAEIKTNTHTCSDWQTGKLANKRSNNAGTAKATKHLRNEERCKFKRKILGNSRIYEYHELRHQSPGSVRVVWFYYLLPFFVCTFSLSPLALPFLFSWVNMSKPNESMPKGFRTHKYQSITAKTAQNLRQLD